MNCVPNIPIVGDVLDTDSLIVHGGCCNIVDGTSPND